MALRTSLLVVFALAGFACALEQAWLRDARAQLQLDSSLAGTSRGLVEYALRGEGRRTLLVIHGTPGGFDQALSIAHRVRSRDLQILALSRPGYLKTPLRAGRTPAEQAEVYAALLPKSSRGSETS